MIGKKFGKLTVIREVRNNVFECKCECGNVIVYARNNLIRGNNKSCGCLHHGMAGTRIYHAWSNMKRRCNDPKNKSYENYGNRGITYDPKWEEFKGFLEDMEEGYNDKLTLDRIEVDGNYCKENCRWVNRTVQANNKTNNYSVEYKGEEFTLAELAKRYKKDPELIRTRISQLGWNVERALTEEPWETITYNGETKKVGEFAEDYGMTYYQLKKRLMRGWTIERALTQPLRKRRS